MRSRRVPGVLVALAVLASGPAGALPDWDPWERRSSTAVPASDPVTAPAVLFGRAAIRAYQFLLSPVLGGRCQFDPSCSRYTIVCMETHGFLIGAWRGADRISRCHGFADLAGYPPGADDRLADPPGR